MAHTWIAQEGLTGLARQVEQIGADLAGARRGLAGAGAGDLGWLADRHAAAVDRAVDALRTAGAAAEESATQIIECHTAYRQTDGAAELTFQGLTA